MKIRILQLLLSTLLLFAMLPTMAFAQDKPHFTMSSSVGLADVGDEVMITVEGHMLNDVYGYELRLSYDPSLMKFHQATTSWAGFTVPPIVEKDSIIFAHTIVGNNKGKSGQSHLASLRFEVIGEGAAAIELKRVKLVDSKGSSTTTAEPGIKVEVTNPAPVKEEIYYQDTVGHWAEKEIARATEMGWVTGYPDGRFAPQEEVTRAQFTTMLARALELSYPLDQVQTFRDHDQIPAYAKAHVAQSVAAGLVKGYEDGTFRPSQRITRSEITVLVMRVLGYDDLRDSSAPLAFADTNQIPQWAYPAVAAASDIGIVQGRDNNRFAPAGYTTRAEAVTLILRLLDQM
ncbi:S-layer homology domain-containing protein [Paenibacillus daejeonensis]|uniref:S-layer homology domain-containing protein n=1 Tax=Paenibacillus daejeonensis TaxID=135193 RepID=UPI00038168D5|nr:S-layer homology domain-containing protein [Paenibacillus daejeonensis]